MRNFDSDFLMIVIALIVICLIIIFAPLLIKPEVYNAPHTPIVPSHFSTNTPEFDRVIGAAQAACMVEGKMFRTIDIGPKGFSSECLTEQESHNKYYETPPNEL